MLQKYQSNDETFQNIVWVAMQLHPHGTWQLLHGILIIQENKKQLQLNAEKL